MLDSTVSHTYQGQFGPFTIDDHDRREVILYRTGLAIAAGSFALGTGFVLIQPFSSLTLNLNIATACFWLMTAGLGLSLWTIHIYLAVLHRALQIFWSIGTLAGIYLSFAYPTPLVVTTYSQPLSILGLGFIFAALTGIFFKEAFCFNRLETKILTPLVPLVLLGHLTGLLSVDLAKSALMLWAAMFLIFAVRKMVQPIDPDIGDKSVFDYLKQQKINSNNPA